MVYLQTKSSDGTYQYQLEPDIDTLGKYEGQLTMLVKFIYIILFLNVSGIQYTHSSELFTHGKTDFTRTRFKFKL